MSGATIAYFDCFSGISGDMSLAALVSAGWDRAALEALPARLGLSGVEIEIGEARRGPFVGARVQVHVEGRQPHRHLRDITALLEAAELEPSVRARARQVFERLAAAEAEVHGQSSERVHFHEVGAADALVDIVGAVEGLRALGVGEVYASPLRLGRGAVTSEHGVIPVPAPATVVLLRGVPVEIPDIEAELVTPTGAALVTTLVRRWTAPPPFRIERIGIGAGTKDLREQPNVLRLFVGTIAGTSSEIGNGAALERRRVAVLETAVDDDNPQFVAELVPRLLERGALDAMVVPTVMKKGRPGMWLVVIADPAQADVLALDLLRETSSLGVRMRIDERYELDRRLVEVQTPFGLVALKVASVPGQGERAQPEFESVRRAAESAGRPLREIAEAAVQAWRQGRDSGS